MEMMIDNKNKRESWQLEVALAITVGLPWYFFASSIQAGVLIHLGLAISFLVLELMILGRGSAILSFLVVIILSTLIGMLLSSSSRRIEGERKMSVPLLSSRRAESAMKESKR